MTGWIAGHPWLPGGSLHRDDGQFALALVIVTAVVFVLAVVAIAVEPAWSAEVLALRSLPPMLWTASAVVQTVLAVLGIGYGSLALAALLMPGGAH